MKRSFNQGCRERVEDEYVRFDGIPTLLVPVKMVMFKLKALMSPRFIDGVGSYIDAMVD